jgi:hypothetical protein
MGDGRVTAMAMKNEDDGGGGNGNEDYAATAMVGGTYNNQLKVSAEEMMAEVAMATERATVTATR